MLKFIIGKKGSGKTNKLIESVNTAVKTDKGHLVFINNGKRHIFDLDSRIRLIDTDEYRITSYQAVYGMICGVLAQDYDVSAIFVDSITKIIKDEDIKSAQDAVEALAELCEKNNIDVVITASIDADEAPDFIKKYV
jgi:thymidine kinase